MEGRQVSFLKRLAGTSLVAASLFCCVQAAEQVRVALPAPSFELKDLDGQLVHSTNFHNKALIVFFWISTDEPCRKQLPVLMELQKKFGDKEFAVVGMALDPTGPQAIKPFAEQHKLTFPILIADYKVIQDFGGLNAVPTLFVIDKRRNIIHKRVGLTDKAVLEDDLKAILKK
jgi:peroxiredoxin